MSTASILEGYTQLGKTCYLCHFIKEKRDTDTDICKWIHRSVYTGKRFLLRLGNAVQYLDVGSEYVRSCIPISSTKARKF